MSLDSLHGFFDEFDDGLLVGELLLPWWSFGTTIPNLYRVVSINLNRNVEGLAPGLSLIEVVLEVGELLLKKANYLVGFLLVRLSGFAVLDVDHQGSGAA
eukprot:TRINITY_DN22214_c0_g1_i1.p1 TRINITY_DN22214_c0_g1~~TRINITY_DN22214_c0_g1_i1.p1  ORF type:complete len:100 (-),score=20.08 TRINITY_DN22214_c0_g1_i1:132-431(-)